MKKLYISSEYAPIFVTQKLPKLFVKLLCKEFKKRENIYMMNYIKDQYRISIEDIAAVLNKSVGITILEEGTIIYIENNNFVTPEIKIETLMRLINYGNREVRGCNAYDNVINYIKHNLSNIYVIYKMKRNLNVWQ